MLSFKNSHTFLSESLSRLLAELRLAGVKSYSLLDGEHDVETVPSFELLSIEHDVEEGIPASFLIAECELENVKSYKDLEDQRYAA